MTGKLKLIAVLTHPLAPAEKRLGPVRRLDRSAQRAGALGSGSSPVLLANQMQG
jgi:hypothetical protein